MGFKIELVLLWAVGAEDSWMVPKISFVKVALILQGASVATFLVVLVLCISVSRMHLSSSIMSGQQLGCLELYHLCLKVMSAPVSHC
jgi:hypothetical protein